MLKFTYKFKYFNKISQKTLDFKGKKYYITNLDRGVEQLVARWAHNPKVRGSNPLPATKLKA